MSITIKDSLTNSCSVYVGATISGVEIDISKEKCYIVCGGQLKIKIPLSADSLFTGSKEECIKYCSNKCKKFEILE